MERDRDVTSSARRQRRWPSPWETLAGSTLGLAVAVALGPVTGVVPVAVLSLVWFVAVPIVIVRFVVTRGRRWTVSHWVFGIGVAAAALRMASLGIVQIVGDRPALFWDVDWRYHATQAYGIARFGGVSDSLDYAGTPVGYHAGPSWIAGSLKGTLGLPVNLVLFVVIPLAAMVVLGLSAYRFLRSIGVGQRAALLAVAVAVNLTSDPVELAKNLLRGRANVMLNPEVWWFTSSLMLNSLLALAVAFTAAWVIVRARSDVVAALGAVGFATVAALKPQYFVGVGAVLGIGYVVATVRGPEPRAWRRLAVVGAAVVLPAMVFTAVTAQSTTFSGIRFGTLGLTMSYYLRARTFLALGVVTIVVLVAVPAARRVQPRRLVQYAVGVVVGAVVLTVFLDTTLVLLDGAQVARARAVGLDYVRSSFHPDVQQAMVPAMLVVAMVALAQLCSVVRGPSRLARFGPVIVAIVVIALTMPFAIAALASPTGRAAYEWSEEPDLRALMARVDADSGVWLSSDLADPSDDFGKPLRAVNLTSLGDAQFYVANVAYGGWTQGDVVRRVRQLQRFYATDWSPWHDDFLRRHDIRFVLVRDRCPARWDASAFPGGVVARQGDWTLLEVGVRGADSAAVRPWPEFERVPSYGRAACRSGRLTS